METIDKDNEVLDSKTSSKTNHRLKANPIPDKDSIKRLREILKPQTRDLLLFDLATQTGVRLSTLLKLKVKDLAGLDVGDRLLLDQSATKDGLTWMTQTLLESYQAHIEAEQPEWDDYLFKSRKRSQPLNLTSASGMVTQWFRNIGLSDLSGSRSLRSTWEVYYRSAIAEMMKIVVTETNDSLQTFGASHNLDQDQVYETILQRIISGHYLPGEKLLPSQVAVDIGVASKIMRNILVRLYEAGFFSGKDKNRFIVAKFSRKDLMDICDLRLAVERLVLEKIYLIRSEETLRRLESRLEVMDQYAKEGLWEAFFDVYEDFHLTMCADANMPIVQHTLQNLLSRLRPYMRIMRKGKLLEFDVDTYKQMLQGLKNQELGKSLENLKKNLLKTINQTALKANSRRIDRKAFRVGMAYNFRGPARTVTIPIFNGCKMVADHINSQGGLNIGGRKYDISFKEIELDFSYEGAATVGRELVEKKEVDLIVGGLVTQTVLGLQAATEPARIITLTTGLGDEVLSPDKSGSYTFRSWIGLREILPQMFHWLNRNHPRAKTIAMIDLDYESAWKGQEMVVNIVDKFALTVVYNDFYPRYTKDFAPWIKQALTKKPDVIINVGSFVEDWAPLIRQARELGFTGLFLDAIPPSPNVLTSLAGISNLNGLIGIDYLTQGKEEEANIHRFRQEYTRTYGQWKPASLLTAPALEMVLRAYEEANTMDTRKVRKILESGQTLETWVGIKGTFACGHRYGQPHQWIADQFLYQINHGELVPLSDGKINSADMINGWEEMLSGQSREA